jgi:methionine-rich copper-binding protein CopC
MKHLLSALLLVAMSAGAYAHAHLHASTPAANSAVKAPAHVTLDYSESIEPAMSKFKVSNASGARVDSGKPVVTHGTHVEVPLQPHLAAGTYSVDWNVLSTDGHVSKGKFNFKVTP